MKQLIWFYGSFILANLAHGTQTTDALARDLLAREFAQAGSKIELVALEIVKSNFQSETLLHISFSVRWVDHRDQKHPALTAQTGESIFLKTGNGWRLLSVHPRSQDIRFQQGSEIVVVQ
jgi:hypothetical protein